MDKSPFPSPTASDDPYLQLIKNKNFQDLVASPQSISIRRRKWDKFINKMGEMRGTLISNAKMGFLVGAISGGTIGLYYAIQTRRMIMVPISAGMMGCTFAGIFGASSIIRAEEIVDYEEQQVEEIKRFARSKNQQA